MEDTEDNKLVIMVSSTVYGHEDLIELIHATLTTMGYEVWASHSGTVRTFSNRTAFENCLDAVDRCDLFLSFITKTYGTGREKPEDTSITHEELRRAIQRDKPRWVLSHHDVVFARNFLRSLGYGTAEQRAGLKLSSKVPIDDLRVIDMYEEATRSEVERLDERTGNWVQKYRTDDDATLYVQAQFHRYQEVKAFIQDNFKNPEALLEVVKSRKGDAS